MTVTVQALSKQIEAKPILTDVSFTWAPGEIIGLVGQNGAGKTTLMRTIMNQYQPDRGQVVVDDQDLATHPEKRRQLVYLDSAHPFFGPYRLTSLAGFYQRAYPGFDQKRFMALLAQYQLDGKKRYGQLSKGMQALVVILLAVSTNAELMLLDEPLDGLDLFNREAVVHLLVDEVAANQRGILIASHDLRELDGLADRVLFLKNGTISQDLTLEALRQSAVKLQLAFADPEVPELVTKRGQVLSHHGRMVEVLFTDYSSALAQRLDALHPLVKEALPIELTDLFRGEYGALMGGTPDVQTDK